MMLDSGYAVSLVRQDVTSDSNTIERMPLPQIQLVTASGDKLPITDCLKASIEVEGQKFTDNFLFVDKLITPVILGIDFLQQHGLTINFSHTPHICQCHTRIQNVIQNIARKDNCCTPLYSY